MKKKKTYPTAMIFLLLSAAIVSFSACGLQRDGGPSDEVVVQLKWMHQAQFAGFYVADKLGFYTEENIDVTLKPGGDEISSDGIISDLVKGEVDFAILGGDMLLDARCRGEPVVAIAVIFQRNPYVYVTLRDSGIVSPYDLVGKKIMVPEDGRVQHNALIRKLDIPKNSIELVPYERSTEPLTSGSVDAYMAYRTGPALAFEEQGYETNFIWVDNYGIRLYADTIITTEKTISGNPSMVKRFLRATLNGWRYAIEHPEEAVEATKEYDVRLSKFRQLRMMQVQTPLIHTGKEKIGWMNRDVWIRMEYILLGKDIIEIDEAFTLKFLNEIYLNPDRRDSYGFY